MIKIKHEYDLEKYASDDVPEKLSLFALDSLGALCDNEKNTRKTIRLLTEQYYFTKRDLLSLGLFSASTIDDVIESMEKEKMAEVVKKSEEIGASVLAEDIKVDYASRLWDEGYAEDLYIPVGVSRSQYAEDKCKEMNEILERDMVRSYLKFD